MSRCNFYYDNESCGCRKPYNPCPPKCPCDCFIAPPCPVVPTGKCRCASLGEQIINGGMELFTGNIPTGWATTTPNSIAQVTARGRIHTGNSSVSLGNGAILTQTVENNITAGCFYELSFFAHGEGAQVVSTATVTFVTPMGNVLGATITANPQGETVNNRGFAYYRVITTSAPANVTGVIISFSTTAEGQQVMDLDNVSFSVK